MKFIFSILFSFVFSSILTAQVTRTITLDSAGTLSNAIDSIEKKTITNLTVKGPIDIRDLIYMKDSLKQLSVLDLNETMIKGNSQQQHSKKLRQYTKFEDNTIPSNAFFSISRRKTNLLKLIILPHSTMSIGSRAFEYCHFLQSIKIPPTVSIIGESSFSYCDTLTTIDIPNSVKIIAKRAFAYCKSLSEIDIPQSVTSINPDAFLKSNTRITVCAENLRYTSVDGVLYSKNKDTLFHIPSLITNFTIPSFVKCIGSYAFGECENLLEIEIPSSVICIDEYAFYSCSNLTNVTIPPSVISIGKGAFCGCTQLKAIIIPNSVETIGSAAFCNCSNLKSVLLPQNIKTLNREMFTECKILQSITIPASVSKIDFPFFDDSIIVDTKNKSYISIDGCLYSTKQDSLFHIPLSKKGDYSVALGVKYISKDAISPHNTLSSITLPSSISSIPLNLTCEINIDKNNLRYSSIDGVLFSKTQDSLLRFPIYPKKKKDIYIIPPSVKIIGKGSFGNCIYLTSVVIPPSVSKIEESAFAYCGSLNTIQLPSSINCINKYAFSNCKAITSIYSFSDIPIHLSNAVFSGIDKSRCIVYVPKESKNAYKETKEWNSFENIIEILPLQTTKHDFKFIPDTILRKELKKMGFLTNDSLDLRKIAEIENIDVYLSSISGAKVTNLEGLQYFTSVKSLTLNYGNITILHIYPPNINYLHCSNNSISKIENLPSSVIELDCQNNNITKLDNLPLGLKELYCSKNKIRNLDKLPSTVGILVCDFNSLTHLEKLPSKLYRLACSNNKITSLDHLPSTILNLYCSHNQITQLNNLPEKLIQIDCSYNNISKIDHLPLHLTELNISKNKLNSINNLSDSLKILECSFNSISKIGKLPNTIENLTINNNSLTAIPHLPKSVNYFNYFSNSIYFDSLPEIYKNIQCKNEMCNCLPIELQQWNILNNKNCKPIHQVIGMKITLSSSYSWGFGSQIETINLTLKDSSLIAEQINVVSKKRSNRHLNDSLNQNSIYSIPGIYRIDTSEVIQIINDISQKNMIFNIKTDSLQYNIDLHKMKYNEEGMYSVCQDCSSYSLSIEIYSKTDTTIFHSGFNDVYNSIFTAKEMDITSTIDWLYLYRFLHPIMGKHKLIDTFFNEKNLGLIKHFIID